MGLIGMDLVANAKLVTDVFIPKYMILLDK